VPVVIERAGVGDWSAIRQARLSALTDAPHAFASTFEHEVDLDGESWQERMRTGAWFIARDDGDPVGLVGGVADRETGGPHLVSMWVDPRARGRGVGSALVEAVKAWAVTAGAVTAGEDTAARQQLILWVADGNDDARRLYERCGFHDTGRRQPLPSDPSVGESLLSCSLAGAAPADHRDHETPRQVSRMDPAGNV
jgi:GNAT superfamily N-acetyltransferase